MKEATTTRSVDYFNLPRPLWRKLKKCLPKKKRKRSRKGGRPRVSDRAVINAIWYVLWTGCQWKAIHRDWFGVSSSVVHQRFQKWRQMGLFEKLMKRMAQYYARECGGISWKWQAMDSKYCDCAAPLGGQKPGNNPTDRGKLGAKINLLVDGCGAPISIVLTGANRHDKVSAIELIVSVVTKSPAHKEQHLCADKAYDSDDLREFLDSAGYEAHIKVNPRRRKGLAEGGGAEHLPNDDESSKRIHPARRWIVERTISWLVKRRSQRTRWSKKAETGWRLFSLPVPTSCSIWRFSDRV